MRYIVYCDLEKGLFDAERVLLALEVRSTHRMMAGHTAAGSEWRMGHISQFQALMDYGCYTMDFTAHVTVAEGLRASVLSGRGEDFQVTWLLNEALPRDILQSLDYHPWGLMDPRAFLELWPPEVPPLRALNLMHMEELKAEVLDAVLSQFPHGEGRVWLITNDPERHQQWLTLAKMDGRIRVFYPMCPDSNRQGLEEFQEAVDEMLSDF